MTFEQNSNVTISTIMIQLLTKVSSYPINVLCDRHSQNFNRQNFPVYDPILMFVLFGKPK